MIVSVWSLSSIYSRKKEYNSLYTYRNIYPFQFGCIPIHVLSSSVCSVWVVPDSPMSYELNSRFVRSINCIECLNLTNKPSHGYLFINRYTTSKPIFSKYLFQLIENGNFSFSMQTLQLTCYANEWYFVAFCCNRKCITIPVSWGL